MSGEKEAPPIQQGFKAALERAKAIAENLRKNPPPPVAQPTTPSEKRGRDFDDDIPAYPEKRDLGPQSMAFGGPAKRTDYGGGGGGYASGGSNEVEIYIPPSSVGYIIGKKGDTLRSIEGQTNTHIKVTQDENPEGKRRVVVSGGNSKDVEAARQIIEQKVDESGRGPSQRSGFGSFSGGAGGGQETMTIPAGRVGFVIGTKGATLNDMQNKSGARINIPRDHNDDPSSGERTVFFTGTPEAIKIAKSLISNMLNGGSNFRGQDDFGGRGETITMSITQEQAGIVIGREGATIKALQQYAKCSIKVEPSSSPTRTVTIYGEKAQVEYAQQLINDTLDNGEFIPPPMADPYATQSYGAPGQQDGGDSAAYYAAAYNQQQQQGGYYAQQPAVSEADYQKQYADYYASYAAYYGQQQQPQPGHGAPPRNDLEYRAPHDSNRSYNNQDRTDSRQKGGRWD